MLLLAYFTEYLTGKYKKNLYNMMMSFSLPGFAAFFVLHTHISVDSIILLFIHVVCLLFYVNPLHFIPLCCLGFQAGLCLGYPTSSPLSPSSYDLLGITLSTFFFLIWPLHKQFISLFNKHLQDMENTLMIVTHELKSPVSHIKTYVTELLKELPPPDDLPEHLKDIITSCDLSLSTIGFRNDHFNTQSIFKKDQEQDLKALLILLINRLPKNQKEKVTLTGTTFEIAIEPKFLVSLFTNLFNNAFHFIQKAGKGHIIITLNSEKYTVSFKDTSCGIKPDILPFIFERGFTRRRDGTGMGLYLCQRYMNYIEGSITCRSVLGEYTEFILFFKIPSRPFTSKNKT